MVSSHKVIDNRNDVDISSQAIGATIRIYYNSRPTLQTAIVWPGVKTRDREVEWWLVTLIGGGSYDLKYLAYKYEGYIHT